MIDEDEIILTIHLRKDPKTDINIKAYELLESEVTKYAQDILTEAEIHAKKRMKSKWFMKKKK